ncbi:amidohydrolase family protein [Modestobacter roseus]|uniref:Cytosine/adenosine deaminase-related metal-dependent hydrolase n=1 Tax=Modestobacter roseus TaxID=1181884 RepID=A0A562IR30_9ACTN|nr:amidohydrolase family protein [Modestobacter roseus]MQA32116.1 amidohydrolase family protein [Modestobacter roseus]TWH73352.1 cytosine/adenosine deaminase-related metal-dependent hydrolase [Modestobacter roseus]
MTVQRTLVRGGHVLSMDPAIGELPSGDVLVEDGVITAVAPDLGEVDAELIDATGHIIAPGLIDTHRHTWQTQLRALCADWVLADYFYGIRLAVSPAYTAADVHLGNLLGAVDALESGVTTILDFSHCNNTPDHGDAAVTGLRDAGIRAVFGYGFFDSSPMAPQHFPDHGARLADFARIAETHFSSDSGLLTLGVALNEMGLVPLSATAAEVRAARERQALIVAHTGCVWSMPSGIRELDAAGLLGPDQVHVHCNTLSDEEWQLLARAGAKVSISVETELNMGMGRPVFAACERHGLAPTLSCDIISLNSGDLFSQLRQGLGFKRWADTEADNLAGRDPERVTTTAVEALRWATVNAAEAIGLGHRIGSLTPGKQADLIVVGGPGTSQHPHVDAAGTLLFQTSTSDVRTVLVAGRAVKRDGVMTGVDLPRLLADADVSADQVLARVRAAVPVLPPTPPGSFDAVLALVAANLAA